MAPPCEHLLTQWAPHQIQIAASCGDDADDAGDDDADDDAGDAGDAGNGAGVHDDHDEDALHLLSHLGPHSN